MESRNVKSDSRNAIIGDDLADGLEGDNRINSVSSGKEMGGDLKK